MRKQNGEQGFSRLMIAARENDASKNPANLLSQRSRAGSPADCLAIDAVEMREFYIVQRGNRIRAAIFDMDGVVTRTATLHAAAWKQAFDHFLTEHGSNGLAWQPFDEFADYRAYVDGKPRGEGVRSFLRGRGIEVPASEEQAIAARKETLFERMLHEQGVQTYASTLAFIRALKEIGVKCAIVTSSRHGRDVLDKANIADLFHVRLDGIDREALSLAGKPNPAMFLRAADLLDVDARQAAILEDAVAGVEAACRGRFGLVVGIDRGGNASALKRAGADIVVNDLAELTPDAIATASHPANAPRDNESYGNGN